MYSQPSAPGVVLATGNVGEYLSGDAQIVNTFLSRDAGATWTEILKGPHIYEFGNHGGAHRGCEDGCPGSHHEGAVQPRRGTAGGRTSRSSARSTCTTSASIPTARGPSFAIHGTDAGSTEGDGDAKGLIYTLDFSKLNDRSGKHWTFGRCDAEKDYER